VSAGLPEGLLLVDKPAGPTSHDVVDRIRRASGLRRVGHAGTLDPLASGLLPVVLGRATRLVRFLPASPKVYRGSLRLGHTTDTDDESGRILSEHRGPLPPGTEVREAASRLLGLREQVPPAYSARRVRGRRLYEWARDGVSVEPPPAEIEVTRFDLESTAHPEVYEFVVEVSAGTYVRALARDLGRLLDCGAALVSLARTRIGPLQLERARCLPAGELDQDWVLAGLIALDQMPLTPPGLTLTDGELVRRFLAGAAVSLAHDDGSRGPCRVFDPGGALLGIGEAQADRLLPRVVLPPAAEE